MDVFSNYSQIYILIFLILQNSTSVIDTPNSKLQTPNSKLQTPNP
ncbi:hypothetical protein GXM_06729 [Nostoc sphaeroides CCNUC1]|uniref:Uncharacterized protein n=1 Tax=Nostoc sphaeroides CCNUC1 TaxID=2653204 RepID=A0A5P8W902_9NOSO|nr:hypothetical protein GXM_06729 [Nostoc sphaeroides CCNUC1]